ncbi:MAG: DUF2510 domain-containing protein [Ilumatobacter sp.]|nr:DUF2510 domain-containing protein [Ilumatobacter sp.]
MVEGIDAPSGTQGNAGWHPDPASRFELRYHNGRAWTADVSTNGERFVDPAGSRPNAPTAAPQTQTASSAPVGRNPIATASMVLGIISIGIGWMPVIVALGLVAALLAIVFGITGRRRAKTAGVGAGFATTGLITGTVGLLACVGGVLFTMSLLQAVDEFENPAPHDAAITSCARSGDGVIARGTLTNTSDSTSTYTVRVFFVRPGTVNARHQANVVIDDVAPGQTKTFETTRNVGELDLECIVGAVRGPLPYGVDPGT